jgi:hypothetical protein
VLSRLRTLIFGSPDDRALAAALARANAVLDTQPDRIGRFGEAVEWRGATRDRADGETSLSFLRRDGAVLRLRLTDRDARGLRAALFDLQSKTRSQPDSRSHASTERNRP